MLELYQKIKESAVWALFNLSSDLKSFLKHMIEQEKVCSVLAQSLMMPGTVSYEYVEKVVWLLILLSKETTDENAVYFKPLLPLIEKIIGDAMVSNDKVAKELIQFIINYTEKYDEPLILVWENILIAEPIINWLQSNDI